MVKEKVLDLANKISRQKRGSRGEIKPSDPEYRILEPLVTDEMAEVALCLELRQPLSAEQIASLCGKPVEKTREILYQLGKDGVIRFGDYDGVDKFFLELWVPGAMEFIVVNKENVKKYPQLAECFEEYSRVRGGALVGKVPVGVGLMRVIPIEESIDGENRRASYEEISKYLNENEIFSVSDCACRVVRETMGEGCGHPSKDMCIQLGSGAEFYIRTGRARQITREEAFEIIERAEKSGLVHQIPNTDGSGKTHAICNCCGCACLSLRHAGMFRSPDTIRSNYVAQVDKEKCVGCGECVENCQVNALKLGEKICASSKEKKVEKKDYPQDTKWGPDKWDMDHRNRKFVYEGGTSPCKTECPAHISVQAYVKLASQGRYTEALELIKNNNPFPAICGRICSKKCEYACTRNELDDPIAIDEIKKFIADQDLHSKHRYIPEKMPDKDIKVAVIGSGPAGLSCAYFLALKGYQVTVFEKENVVGGMLMLGIPSFRLEKDVINAEIDILRELGIEFKTQVEVGKDISIKELRKEGYKAFYLAIGAQSGRKINVKGEDAQGVCSGIDFLRDINLGNEVKLSGKTIVIGGGNVAIDVARAAKRCDSSVVEMYCLEGKEKMPALDEEIQEALHEGIVINNSWGPNRIIVKDNKVVGIEFIKCTSVFDEEGKFNPQYDKNNKKIVDCDNVLISVGQQINWGVLKDDLMIETKGNGIVEADNFTYQTSEKDIFTGGDVLTGPRFAIDAIAMGKQGAQFIHRYVNGHSLTIGCENSYFMLDRNNVNLEGYDKLPRQKVNVEYNSNTLKSFNDPRLTFTEEQVKKETERCLGCGVTIADEHQCVGCGVCVTKCKFDAVHLVRKYDAESVDLKDLKPTIVKHTVKREFKIVKKNINKLFKI